MTLSVYQYQVAGCTLVVIYLYSRSYELRDDAPKQTHILCTSTKHIHSFMHHRVGIMLRPPALR